MEGPPRLLGRLSASPSAPALKYLKHGNPSPVLPAAAQLPGIDAVPYPHMLLKNGFAGASANVAPSSKKTSGSPLPPGTSPPPRTPPTPLPPFAPPPQGTPAPSLVPAMCKEVQQEANKGDEDCPPPPLISMPGAPPVQPTKPTKQHVNTETSEVRESSRYIKFGADLENKVKLCFKKVAGDGTLDVNGVRQIRNMLMEMLGLPKRAFGDMETQLLRFDLNGDRRFDIYEVFQSVKMNLFEYCKQSGHGSHEITIPQKSIKEAGYKIGRELGHGNQGCAYAGKNSTGELCCVKGYAKTYMDKSAVDSLQDEFNVLHNLSRHPNVAFAFEIFQDDNSYYMILELYSGGDFATLSNHCSGSSVQIDGQWWRALFKQCFLGLAHMHANGLIHCDIKEPNLMLRSHDFKKPQVVIIDFGLVRTAASDDALICGTPGYIAPESWQTAKLYPGSDIFATGVVMMQMLLDRVPPHHNPPSDGMMPGGIFTDGCKNLRDVKKSTCSKTPPFHELSSRFCALANLLPSILDKDVSKRPCAQQVLHDI